MATCVSCGSQVPDSGRFCLSCGAAMVSGDELATMEFVYLKPRASARASSGSAKASSSSGSLLTEV